MAEPITTILTTLGSMVLPPLLEIVKAKALGTRDPVQMLSSLAVNEKTAQVIPSLIENWRSLIETQSQLQVKMFNVDVIGQPSQWVVDLRASIRPVTVIISLLLFIISPFITVPDYVQQACAGFIGFWFGNRMVEKWK